MADELDQIIDRLRTAPLAERLAVDFEPRELPEHDPRLAVIAELLLEAPRSEGEWSRFYGLEHQLPNPQLLGTDATEPEWSAAAQRARIVERLGEPFKAIAMATRAVANGAPRGPWARFLDTEAAAAWEAPSLLFAPWEVAAGRAHIARTVPSTGPARMHRIAAVLEVSSEEGAAWSVIPDGGRELLLREEDMCELERAFGRKRYELGGRDVPSSALTPERALLEPLLALRVPAIEAFVARLVPAIDRGLSANSIAPLEELFAARPSVAPAVVWFAQAIVGKDHAHAVTWNDSAAKALPQLVGPDTELDLQAVRSLVGPYGLLLACYRGELKLGIQIGNAGRVSLTTGDGWTPAELAETSLEAIARGVEALEREAFDEAIAILDEAATQADADISVHVHRASADYGLGLIREALAGYEAILPRLRGPEKAFVFTNSAALHRELDDPEAALRLEQRATEEMPDNPDAWYEYGLALVKRGEYDDCIAAEKRALSLDPEHANAHYAIACGYALRDGGGDREHAFHHITEAIACDPDLADDIAGDDDFAALRADVRFGKLTRS